MIFAAFDYTSYFLGKGHYSHNAVISEGMELASVENFPDLENVPPMSFLFCHTRGSFLGWLVMYYTNSIRCHVAGFMENGMLLDATTSGVIKHPASDYLDNKSYLQICTTKPMYADHLRDYMTRCEFVIGDGFNWAGVIFFWLHIIIGNDEAWRLKHSLDLFVLFYILTLLNPKFMCLNVIYGIFLAFFLFKRIVWKRKKVSFFGRRGGPN